MPYLPHNYHLIYTNLGLVIQPQLLKITCRRRKAVVGSKTEKQTSWSPQKCCLIRQLLKLSLDFHENTKYFESILISIKQFNAALFQARFHNSKKPQEIGSSQGINRFRKVGVRRKFAKQEFLKTYHKIGTHS